MNSQATQEYLALLWSQYQACTSKVKATILDEICRNLEMHRKSAIRAMNSKHPPRSRQGKTSSRPKKYGKTLVDHLTIIWRTSGYMCSTRLHAALPLWLGGYDHPTMTPAIRSALLAMSARSIERSLTSAKAALRKRLNTGTRAGVRPIVTQIPVKNLQDRPIEVGHFEADLVAHCGGSLSGTFAWSLTVTDVVSGWTECESVWGKDGHGVKVALFEIEKRLPFKMKSISFDNGTEFLNDSVVNGFAKCPERGFEIQVVRGRAYHKNDQCFVEQKNNTHVREYFGYGRLGWPQVVSLMNSIYRGKWRILQNFFCPQQKVEFKQRLFSKIKRRMGRPKTPYERLSELLPPDEFAAIESEGLAKNPFELTSDVRGAIRNIYQYFKERNDSRDWGRKVV